MFIKVEGDTTKGYHHNRIFDKEVGDIPRIIFLIKRGGDDWVFFINTGSYKMNERGTLCKS
jgi:hypothetical protein